MLIQSATVCGRHGYNQLHTPASTLQVNISPSSTRAPIPHIHSFAHITRTHMHTHPMHQGRRIGARERPKITDNNKSSEIAVKGRASRCLECPEYARIIAPWMTPHTLKSASRISHFYKRSRALHESEAKQPAAASQISYRISQGQKRAQRPAHLQRDRNSRRKTICSAGAPSTLQRVQGFVAGLWGGRAAR